MTWATLQTSWWITIKIPKKMFSCTGQWVTFRVLLNKCSEKSNIFYKKLFRIFQNFLTQQLIFKTPITCSKTKLLYLVFALFSKSFWKHVNLLTDQLLNKLWQIVIIKALLLNQRKKSLLKSFHRLLIKF